MCSCAAAWWETQSLAFGDPEASSFCRDAHPIEFELVPTMIAASRTISLEHRESAGVLTSSDLFFAGLPACAFLFD